MFKICIFYSDLVWRMQVMQKYVLCVCMLIEFFYTISELIPYSLLYTRNLQNKRLKPVLEYIIIVWICVLVLRIHKGYFVVKELESNVCNKAFWCTTNIWFLNFRNIVLYSYQNLIMDLNFKNLNLKNIKKIFFYNYYFLIGFGP